MEDSYIHNSQEKIREQIRKIVDDFDKTSGYFKGLNYKLAFDYLVNTLTIKTSKLSLKDLADAYTNFRYCSLIDSPLDPKSQQTITEIREYAKVKAQIFGERYGMTRFAEEQLHVGKRLLADLKTYLVPGDFASEAPFDAVDRRGINLQYRFESSKGGKYTASYSISKVDGGFTTCRIVRTGSMSAPREFRIRSLNGNEFFFAVGLRCPRELEWTISNNSIEEDAKKIQRQVNAFATYIVLNL